MAVFGSPLVDALYLLTSVVITYVAIFHLLLWFENRKALQAKTAVERTPAVSVIVPAYNEEQTIGRTLKNLLGLDYPKNKLEIVVVDDGSTDRTYEQIKKIKSPRIKILRQKNGGKASALNFGLAKTKHDLVAVVDADSFPEKAALLKAVQYFSQPKIAAVTSHVLVGKKKTVFEKWQDLEFMLVAVARKVREKLNLIDATPGAMSVYRKEVLKRLGGFDEKNLLEDVEIAWRLLRHGYKIKMAYDAVVRTNYPDSWRKWWQQRTRWGVGGLQTLAKHLGCLFRFHPLGTFIIPLSLLGYFLQLAGVFVFLYFVSNWLISQSLFLFQVFALGSKVRFDYYYPLSLFSFYGLIILGLGLLTVAIGLRHYPARPRIFTLLTFLTVYIFLFPLVGVYSLYKYLRKDWQWFTK